MQGPAVDGLAEHDIAGADWKPCPDEVPDKIADCVVVRIFPPELKNLVDAAEDSLGAFGGGAGIGIGFPQAFHEVSHAGCAAHGIALSIVIRDLTPGKLHDFAHHVASVVSGLDRLVAEAVERPVSGLEAYVAGRLNASAGPQLLDQLPLYVAIGACELFGAVATLGRPPDLKRLTDEQWHAAGGAGFEIFAGGEGLDGGDLPDGTSEWCEAGPRLRACDILGEAARTDRDGLPAQHRHHARTKRT
jgi:hypothetical protein